MRRGNTRFIPRLCLMGFGALVLKVAGVFKQLRKKSQQEALGKVTVALLTALPRATSGSDGIVAKHARRAMWIRSTPCLATVGRWPSRALPRAGAQHA